MKRRPSAKMFLRIVIFSSIFILSYSVEASNINMTNGSTTGCPNNFFDSGGSGSPYNQSESFVYTFYPTTGCNAIQAAFSAFDIESSYDYLYIYNGNSTSATLIGTYTGTTSPGTITSSASDGSLTFRFTSDGSIQNAGWQAAITCVAPPNMSFTSSTSVVVSSASVTKCDIDQQMVRIEVVVAGTCSPLSLTQVLMTTAGSTAIISDVSKIHIYYTGTSPAFNNSNEFVPNGTTPLAGAMTINGSQALITGTNYFWIAYDLLLASGTSNTISARCTQINIGGLRTPTATPTSSSTIAVCPSYPSTNALGLKQWVKSDAGVSGSPVSTWSDQINLTIGNFTSTGTSRPTVVTNAVNFQDYIRFDGVNDTMKSNTNFSGGTLYSTTDNTIFMIKNYKSGTVDYKWETDPTNSYRIGMEINGSSQRIDFVDDNGGGKNDLGTTNIINKDVMVEYFSDASTINLKLNGNIEAVKTHSLTFNPGGTISHPLFIGGNGFTNGSLFAQVDIAEVMTYNKKLTSSELRRVESYLALKYGITLKNNIGNGPSVTYMASDGTQIWSNQTGYHNYVIGIGRDNAAGNSGLNKLKSKSVSSLNSSTDILTIANNSISAPAAFVNDKAFLMVGSNAGSLSVPITGAFTHGGPATAIAVQLSRVWATQKTGTHSGNLIIEINMSLISGSNANADIRLLVDNDATFSNASAGEHTYSATAGYAATGGIIDFIVPYSDIQTGTGYFTIGSVNNATAPLPIELLSFNAQCNGNKVSVNWSTTSETNNDYFTISRTTNGIDLETIAIVDAAGTTTSTRNYSWIDNIPLNGNSYYHLSQTDFDGSIRNFDYVSVDCKETENDLAITNTSNNDLEINIAYSTSYNGMHTIKILDFTGRVVLFKNINAYPGHNTIMLDGSSLAGGIYIINILNNQKSISRKILVKK